MPTIIENKQVWDNAYEWEKCGDEWSIAWGDSKMQWYGSILPRIQNFIPTQKILEIAPGHGRWTQFLKNYCDELIVIDLSEKCINSCKERFKNSKNITYHLNDGKSLKMIADETIDFIFTFDSLVHVDSEIIDIYISQLSRILKKDGVAFIHHSNLGEYKMYKNILKIPIFRGILSRIGVTERSIHWRSFNMTAKKFEQMADKYDLTCICQEIIPWNTRHYLIDSISTITKKNSVWSRKNVKYKNSLFMKEAKYISTLAKLYSFKVN